LYAADPGGETRVLRLTPIRSSETNRYFNCLGTIPKNMAVEYDAAKEREVLPMRTILGCAALALALSTATIPAQAKGCIKGALIGGTAGHFADHHGLLGAAAGCVIGQPPETIKAAAAELANVHGSLSLKRRLTHKRARLALSPISTSLAKSASERVRRSTL
jgi:hypothetical protein